MNSSKNMYFDIIGKRMRNFEKKFVIKIRMTVDNDDDGGKKNEK